jgi:hypothetical protein
MKRLIDDMSAQDILDYWYSNDINDDLFQCLDKLCAPIPEWYDKLDPDDDDTWVLCFVDDYDPTNTSVAVWIDSYNVDRETFHFGVTPDQPFGVDTYTYATPVDLNIRYKGKE